LLIVLILLLFKQDVKKTVDILYHLIYLQNKSREEITVEKRFQILTGVMLLLLLIATMINIVYLLTFCAGFFFALFFVLFFWRGENLAGWIILCSLAAACFVFVIWIGASIVFKPIGLISLLSVIGGALFPSIAASAYLESR